MNTTPSWLYELIRLPDMNTNLKTFGGHRQHVEKGWKVAKESHFAFEIIWIIEGEQYTRFENHEKIFYEGDIVLIPPGTLHENQCIHDQGLTYFCLHFDIDDPEIQQILFMYCPLVLVRQNRIYEKIMAILQEYLIFLTSTTFTTIDKLKIEILVLELMCSLIEYATQEKVSISHSQNRNVLLSKEIATAIQENFRTYTNQPNEANENLLSMATVAQKLNISTSTMLKVFKGVYFISPKQYLDQLRFNEAKYLLHQPKLAIGEISEMIGYQNAAHFTRQFKKWATISPSKYRELQLRKE